MDDLQLDLVELVAYRISFVYSFQFVNDGGYNSGMSGISGVPTRTTSTLTPTTLRNIEQVRTINQLDEPADVEDNLLLLDLSRSPE